MSGLQSNNYEQTADLRDDARWALVNRIVTSEAFGRSRRLRQLLIYLSECALRDPQNPLTEQQVGVAVFKRPPGYNTTADTVVRVRASEIRKRLKYYFLTEGLQEPLIIDLPKGSYLPVFSLREPVETPQTEITRAEGIPVENAVVLNGHGLSPAPPAPEREQLSRSKRFSPQKTVPPVQAFLLASLLVVATASVIWLAYQNTELRKASTATENATPFLSHFWTQFFQNGKQTELVPSDAGVIALADALGRNVTLEEYSDPAYPKPLVDRLLRDPRANSLVARAVSVGAIMPYDASILGDLSLLSGRYQIPLQIILPRKALVNPDSSGNIILLGHERSNPWVSLFQDRLNFRHQFDDVSRKAMIVNTSPLPGEERFYVSEFDNEDFSVAACLPKPGGNGSILLLFGGRLAAVDGAASLVTDEAEMAKLHARLGVGPSDPIPYFEVLLDKRSTATSYEIIAQRIIKTR